MSAHSKHAYFGIGETVFRAQDGFVIEAQVVAIRHSAEDRPCSYRLSDQQSSEDWIWNATLTSSFKEALGKARKQAADLKNPPPDGGI